MENKYYIYILKLLPINVDDINAIKTDLPMKLYNIINSLKLKGEINTLTINLSYNFFDLNKDLIDLKNKYSKSFDININYNNEYVLLNEIYNILDNNLNQNIIIINYNIFTSIEEIVSQYSNLIYEIVKNLKTIGNMIFFKYNN